MNLMGIHGVMKWHSLQALPKNPNPGENAVGNSMFQGEKHDFTVCWMFAQCLQIGGGGACCHMCSPHFLGGLIILKHTHLLSSFCDCIFYCETKQVDFPFLTSHPRWFPVLAVGPPGVRSSSEIWNKLLGNCLRWRHGRHDTRLCISRRCCKVSWICFSGDICTENPMVNHPKKKKHRIPWIST